MKLKKIFGSVLKRKDKKANVNAVKEDVKVENEIKEPKIGSIYDELFEDLNDSYNNSVVEQVIKTNGENLKKNEVVNEEDVEFVDEQEVKALESADGQEVATDEVDAEDAEQEAVEVTVEDAVEEISATDDEAVADDDSFEAELASALNDEVKEEVKQDVKVESKANEEKVNCVTQEMGR